MARKRSELLNDSSSIGAFTRCTCPTRGYEKKFASQFYTIFVRRSETILNESR